jgi:hypothetical protein
LNLRLPPCEDGTLPLSYAPTVCGKLIIIHKFPIHFAFTKVSPAPH